MILFMSLRRFIRHDGKYCVMRTVLLIPLLALVCACATTYELPTSTVPSAEVRFIGLGSATPLDSIDIIDPAECKPIKRVEPSRSATGMFSRFPLNQPVSLMVSYRGMQRSAYGNTPFQCTYGFTFTPEAGKEYQVRAIGPKQAFWTLSDSEAKSGRFPNRLPDNVNCVPDVIERNSANGGWRSAPRERICVDSR